MGAGPPSPEREEEAELGVAPAVEERAKGDMGPVAQLTSPLGGAAGAPPTAKPLPLHGSSHLARCALPLGAGPGRRREEGGKETVGGAAEG